MLSRVFLLSALCYATVGAVNYADVREKVANAFAEKANEMADALEVLQGLSKESSNLLGKISAHCGASLAKTSTSSDKIAEQTSTALRLVDASGSIASVGLLQVAVSGGFGSVCGANLAAAQVVCGQMGYDHGVVSSSPCGSYGGADLCGAAGSPVAFANLECDGSELDIQDCKHSAPSAQCSSHALDSIIYCSNDGASDDGNARLIAADGSPSIDGSGRLEVFHAGAWTPVCSSGISSGAGVVACKSMGFAGASATPFKSCGGECGTAAPTISELTCSGSEDSVLSCPHESGDDVFCAPEEAVVLSCAGDGETQGRPGKAAAPQIGM